MDNEPRLDPQPPSFPPPSEKPRAGLFQRISFEVSERTRNLLRSPGGDPGRNLAGWTEWAASSIQKQGFGAYGKLLTILLCTFFLADLTALLAGKYIPEPPSSRGTRGAVGFRRQGSLDEYAAIFARNLFNSKGLIPGEELPTGGEPQDLGGAPVKTTLPFNLIGTLILRDELRSIATIEDKSASLVYPVRVDDEIPAKARIIKVEPTRVTFVNTASGRREYVELPEDLSRAPRISLGGPKTAGGAGIEQVSPTQYTVSRLEVDKALSDFNNILTQARAVPNFENGLPAGYKLFQIVPGSIYDKLGLRNGDVITGLDGQPINDPGKAFEMLSRLKDSNHLELQVKKDGRSLTYSYDIK
ncbi:MAG: hypothetical protein NDJ89_11525 [Oligoflexia bacterium]|nr:hypothetical protein [Oligoflexia bacterium]